MGAMNKASIVLLLFMMIVNGLFNSCPNGTSPDQMPKSWPRDGVAVSTTVVPVGYIAVHVPGQEIPPELLVTAPMPLPLVVIVNVKLLTCTCGGEPTPVGHVPEPM